MEISLTLLLSVLLPVASCLQSQDLVFVVLSQPNIHHAHRAEFFKRHLQDQFPSSSEKPVLHLLHEKWGSTLGAWTIFPILSDILKYHADKAGVFICEEETRIDTEKLVSSLQEYDFEKALFLGRALYDQEPSIIHHFAFYDVGVKTFPYPDFSAGFILSMPLVRSMVDRLDGGRQGAAKDFTIDAKHELAMFIWNEGKGIKLSPAPFLCSGDKESQGSHCATTCPTNNPAIICKKEPIPEEKLFVAVKTCEKYHKDRVPIVKSTWGAEAKFIEYYSETYDETIPTTVLGVPNTERGHCGKLLAILRRANTKSHITDKDWILIADDDSIINLSRLRQLLACYDPVDPVVLGERYGFGLSRPSGYDYLTGGSGLFKVGMRGSDLQAIMIIIRVHYDAPQQPFPQEHITTMVLTHMAVRIMIDSGVDCPADDSPDDMMMGMWLKQLHIPILHSPLFHQATPAAYSLGYLENQIPISFHKHWNVDPIKVYKELLGGTSTSREKTKQKVEPTQSSIKEEL